MGVGRKVIIGGFASFLVLGAGLKGCWDTMTQENEEGQDNFEQFFDNTVDNVFKGGEVIVESTVDNVERIAEENDLEFPNLLPQEEAPCSFEDQSGCDTDNNNSFKKVEP